VCLANSAFIAEQPAEAGGGAASVAIVLNLLGAGPAVDAGDRAADGENAERECGGRRRRAGGGRGVTRRNGFAAGLGLGRRHGDGDGGGEGMVKQAAEAVAGA
jgi:hypothetical protein